MLSNRIPIDFVAGTHGHFLETTLNKFFKLVPDTADPFTATGTSHNKSIYYNKNKVFHAEHWFECCPDYLKNFKKVVSIRFEPDDMLLMSSISLLRAGDFNISSSSLDVDTVGKLNNRYYRSTLAAIYNAYPFLDQSATSIPRHVLREFYKFGFKDPYINGYWAKRQQMTYMDDVTVCYFNFASFYNIEKFTNNIKIVEDLVGVPFNFTDEFYQWYDKFLSFIPYTNHKTQCDHIVDCVKQELNIPIENLTLFQESYISGQLENIYGVEMPFHQNEYFTSTKDVLYYINTASKL